MRPLLYLLFLFTTVTARNNCSCGILTYSGDLDSEEIKSPGYPSGYCHEMHCVYEIEPRAGASLHLSLNSFETEAIYDCLHIEEFYWAENGEMVKVYRDKVSGTLDDMRRYVTALNSGLRLTFITDRSYGSVQDNPMGFQATFSRSSLTYCPPFYQTVAAEAKQLHYSSDDHKTAFMIGCSFLFNSSLDQSVLLRFHDLPASAHVGVEQTSQLRDVTRPTDVVFHDTPGTTYTSPLNSLTMHLSIAFASDILHFNITYETAPSPCNCFPSLYTLDGTTTASISSPGFPRSYCPRLHCRTTLNSEPSADASHVRVTRLLIHFQHTELDKDTLTVLVDDAEYKKLSGLHINQLLTIPHHRVDLVFQSDASISLYGFNISATSELIPAGALFWFQTVILEGQAGSVLHTIPPHCQHIDCIWDIEVFAAAEILRMRLDYAFSGVGEFLSLSHDMLEYRYGSWPGAGDREEHEFEDDSKHKMKMWYHRALPAEKESTFQFHYNWTKRCDCGQVYRDVPTSSWSELTSPNYPERYCNQVVCRYMLSAPPGYRILLNITDFHTEMGADVLAIFDGDTIEGKHKDALSGWQIFPSLIRSRNETMTLMFHSDVSISATGFRILYSAEPIPVDKADSSASPPSSHFFLYSFLLLSVIGLAAGGVVMHRRGRTASFRNPLFERAEYTYEREDRRPTMFSNDRVF